MGEAEKAHADYLAAVNALVQKRTVLAHAMATIEFISEFPTLGYRPAIPVVRGLPARGGDPVPFDEVAEAMRGLRAASGARPEGALA